MLRRYVLGRLTPTSLCPSACLCLSLQDNLLMLTYHIIFLRSQLKHVYYNIARKMLLETCFATNLPEPSAFVGDAVVVVKRRA